jgi:hypothetical protein
MQSPTPSTPKHTGQTSQSRREFLTKTALLTGGLLAFGLPFPSRQSRSALAATKPQSTAIRYALGLDGQIAGLITSLDSGFISGQVSEQPLPQSPNSKKHLSTIVYEDIAIQCGNTMSPAFYLWIQQTLAGQAPRRNGGILTTNLGNQIIDRKDFSDAVVTEVAFPALDRSANTSVSLGVKITPTQLSYQSGGGQMALPTKGKPVAWLASNFRITIDGLEQACAHVVRVESLVWKQPISQGQIDTQRSKRSKQSTLGHIQTPNLILTVPQAQAGPFTQWFYQFVIQGQASDSAERSGTLEFLASDLQTILFILNFGNLGIFRMSPVPQSQNGPMPLVTVELYCETMQLTKFPNS